MGPLPAAATIDGNQFLSPELVQGLKGKVDITPDLNLGIPFSYHRGYQSSPIPGLFEGYGRIGLGEQSGWGRPGNRFGYVHNRLLTLMLFDMGSFAGLAPLLSAAIGEARRDGPVEVPNFRRPVRGLVYRRSRRRRIARRGITRRRIATPYRLPAAAPSPASRRMRSSYPASPRCPESAGTRSQVSLPRIAPRAGRASAPPPVS